MMFTASMLSTSMILSMVVIMVITHYVWIIYKISLKKSGGCIVCISGHSSIKLNICCCQSCLGASTDTTADQNIRIQRSQYASQCTMTAAIRIYNL